MSSVCDCESCSVAHSVDSGVSSNPEGFVFQFGSNGLSSSSYSGVSSNPEGFVFQFGSNGLSTSSSSVPITTTPAANNAVTDSSIANNGVPLANGGSTSTAGANRAGDMPKRNTNTDLIQARTNLWSKTRTLDSPLCLKYPPASSSSISSSSPVHSAFNYVSSSYISFDSSSSSSFSS